MNRGQQVRCTNHNGRHTGRVAHVITPTAVAVAWDGYQAVPNPGSRNNPDAAWMLELSATHNLAITSTDELEVVTA